MIRDSQELRKYTIEFIFNENDYLENNTLTKVFSPKKDCPALGEDDMRWADCLETTKSDIKWKNDKVNLCKLKPTSNPEGGSESFEPGSFFSSFFESDHPEVANGIGQIIADEVWPNAFDWYTGDAVASGAFDFSDDEEDDDDDEDDEEESEDDGAEEIDLDEKDKPATKKQKTSK